MLSTILMMIAAQAASPLVIETAIVEPDVRSMSPRDIKTFNQTVAPSHPYHIRCIRQVDIGSLVKGTTTCKTNQQWAKVEQIGNENARDVGDRMATKLERSSDDPTGSP